MTHVGQKVALGSGGFLGHLPCPVDFRLGLQTLLDFRGHLGVGPLQVCRPQGNPLFQFGSVATDFPQHGAEGTCQHPHFVGSSQ